MPTNGTAAPFWYSFNVGRIHFVAFDIDQSWQSGSAQYAFLAADLAAVDRAATPFVVAYSHFPMLCSNNFWVRKGSGELGLGRAFFFSRPLPPLPPHPLTLYPPPPPAPLLLPPQCNDGSGSAQAFRKLYEPLFNAPETRVHIFL
jgi:hypothetical protein